MTATLAPTDWHGLSPQRSRAPTRPVPEFCVLTAVLPDYRLEFVRELDRIAPGRVRLFAGSAHLDASVRTGLPASLYTDVRNHFMLGRRVFLQTGAWREASRAAVTVVDLNPRSLNAWSLLIVRGLHGRRTLVWGHLCPRQGPTARTAPIRRAMRRMAKGTITYTWSDRATMQARGYDGGSVWVAPNALYLRSELSTMVKPRRRTDILYVGRLEVAKKPELLLKAFRLALPRLPPDARLVFIGDGSQRHNLERSATDAGICHRTIFLGRITDFNSLREQYSTTVCSVSPGYAGLSLTQSLGFGVPMVVADDENHAPEIELAEPGGVAWFRADSVDALADQLAAQSAIDLRPDDRDRIRASTLRLYTADAMARGFLAALKGVPAWDGPTREPTP